jgi:hypothetical protein
MLSWRKWPDLVADFGRELYIPWRLAEGAVLYRDVDDFYGPLSQYLNAALFRIFDPGIMVLVVANLVVFAVVVAMVYHLVRRAWDTTTALVVAVVFVAIFGFSRFIGTGSFNYVAPYSHESTHGMLVLLLLVAVSGRFIGRPALASSLLGGGLFGLTLVLKPEFILAAGVVTSTAVVMAVARSRPLKLWWCAAWLAVATLPTLIFVAYFLVHVPFPDAWRSACRAWLNVIGTTRFVREPAQIFYSGFDAPWRHLAEHIFSTVAGVVVMGVFVWIGQRTELLRASVFRWLVGGGLALVVVVVSFALRPHWFNVGKSLLGLTLVWLAFQIFQWRQKTRESDVEALVGTERRILLGVAAASMMGRMLLNGRIYQFGFYQAALAAVVVVAAMVGELPNFRTRGLAGRLTVLGAVGALLMVGVGLYSLQNITSYRAIDTPVGTGSDMFLTYNPKYYSQGTVTQNVVKELRETARGQTLLVLPEGLMLNYLTRMPSPLPHFFYYSVVTADGREAQIVNALASRPPDWVILWARDLSEYGIANWGQRSGSGKELLEWVSDNYESVGRVDGSPMKLERDGMLVLKRKIR